MISNGDLGGGADAKWDASRQIRIKSLNPKLYPKNQLDSLPGFLWDNQPVASDTPVSYPADDVIGNDDTTTGDPEDNNRTTIPRTRASSSATIGQAT